MKRCPECRRDYYDDTLLYCLDDGNALLEGPASGRGAGEEPATAILDVTAPPNEAPTRAQISTTNETAILADPLQPRQQSSAEYLLGRMKGRKLTVLLVVVALVVVVGGGGFGIYKWFGSNRSPAVMRAPKITRLTNSGRVVMSAISPDGKYVAYIQTGEADKPSIWIRQVSAASDAQIVPEEDGASYFGITFAPDGEFVYFVKRTQGNVGLWRTPILGGAARKLNIEHINSARISLSPDGKQIAFGRQPEQGGQSIVVANLDGSGEKTLSTNEQLWGSPAWSSDGSTLVVGVGLTGPDAGRRLISVRVDDGSERHFNERVWAGNKAPEPIWLADGSGVLLRASEDAGERAQIWFLGVGDSVGQQITGDLSEYGSIGLTANSATICAVRTEETQNLWVADVSDLENPRPITSGSERNDGERGLSWTPDGKILYYSTAGGGQNIWLTASDGTGNKQVTTPAKRNRDAQMSPDGRYIVWESNHGEGNNIWRMDLDGGDSKQLTHGGPDYYPLSSPDSKWVIFARNVDGAIPNICRVAINGGDPTPIIGTEKAFGGGSIFFSQDGTRVFFLTEGSQKNLIKLVSVPFEGGEPITSFELPAGATGIARKGPDGRSITYVRQIDGQDNIWSQPLDGGTPKQLTHYKSLDIQSFAWSLDGKKIVLSRRSTASDVVLIKDFR